jgi:large conductance mechanosensitive channel
VSKSVPVAVLLNVTASLTARLRLTPARKQSVLCRALGGVRKRGKFVMSMVSEFKEFIARGNVVDLAVGVVIGGAFGKIVDSFVNGIIMPVVGLATGGIDFNAQKIILKAAEGDVPEVAIAYGSFIGTIITFLIVAAAVFMMVKAINRIRQPAAAPPAGPTDVELLAEIRDLLKR